MIPSQGGCSLASRLIERTCPKCGAYLRLRLPLGTDEGRFSVRCSGCSADLDVQVEKGDAGRKVYIGGRRAPPLHKMPPPPRPPSPPIQTKLLAEEITGEEVLPFGKRLKVVTFILVVVGILGIISSMATLSGSFSIKDLEQQSPSDVTTFSVWAIDSETGRGIEDVRVTLYREGYNTSTDTDLEGLAVIKGVSSGEIGLTLSKEGYRTIDGEVTISRGSPNVLDVPMTKGASEDVQPLLIQPLEPKTYSNLYTDITAVFMMLCSIMALVSAYFVHKREFFLIALLTAFLSMFSFGFMIGSILALASVIVIILSYKGFEHTHDIMMRIEDLAGEDINKLFRGPKKELPQLPPLRGK